MIEKDDLIEHAVVYGEYKVGSDRCKLDPSLKAPGFKL